MSKEKKEMSKQDKVVYSLIALIAMLIFIVITAIGFAKLEKAEAAVTSDGIYYPDLSSVDAGGYEALLQEALKNSDNMVVFTYYDGSDSEPNYVYRFVVGSPKACADGDRWKLFTSYHVQVKNGRVLVVSEENADLNFIYPSYDYVTYGEVIGATYDYRVAGLETYRASNITPFKIKEPAYLVNAPYLQYKSLSIYNALASTMYETDIEESEWKCTFELMGQPMTPQDGYEAFNEYYIYLPSVSYLDSMMSYYMPADIENGTSLKEFDLETLEEDIVRWQTKVGVTGNSILYRVKISDKFEHNSLTEKKIRFDYLDLLDAIEYQYGHKNDDGEWQEYNLASMYGMDSDSDEWKKIYRPLLMSYLFISRVDSILYTYNTPDIYYGRYMTFDFMPNSQTVITTEINEDYLANTDNFDSVVNDGRTDTLKEQIATGSGTIEDLRQQISNSENSLGSYDIEFDGEGLWSSFRGVAQGVLGLGSTLSGIAGAFGSVFSFFPVDVQRLMGYTFIVLCVVAVWKALSK